MYFSFLSFFQDAGLHLGRSSVRELSIFWEDTKKSGGLWGCNGRAPAQPPPANCLSLHCILKSQAFQSAACTSGELDQASFSNKSPKKEGAVTITGLTAVFVSWWGGKILAYLLPLFSVLLWGAERMHAFLFTILSPHISLCFCCHTLLPNERRLAPLSWLAPAQIPFFCKVVEVAQPICLIGLAQWACYPIYARQERSLKPGWGRDSSPKIS